MTIRIILSNHAFETVLIFSFKQTLLFPEMCSVGSLVLNASANDSDKDVFFLKMIHSVSS